MEFCTRIANQLMLKGIQNGLSKNIVSSPLSINVVLNMVTTGFKGRTLERFLGLLGSKNVEEINAKSRKMMAVTEGDGSSPLSINVVLNMVTTGFKGRTLERFLGLLGSKNVEEINAKSRKMMAVTEGDGSSKDVYNGPILTMANQVVDEINSWASTASRGLIKNILQHGSIPEDTILILANGLYFKGIWGSCYEFDAERTEKRKFYLLNGSTVSVPFMTSTENYYCGSFDGFKVLKIPYQCHQANNFSMYFFLPDERDGLQDLLLKFDSNSGFLDQEYFKLREMDLNEFWIPKFKFSFDFDVLNVMEDMGESLSLNPGDLSEMIHNSGEAPIFISKMFQKAYIEVNEKGTEAAAITGIAFRIMCARICPKINFVADHPFVFMIREEGSGLVLFTGTVMNPLQEG